MTILKNTAQAKDEIDIITTVPIPVNEITLNHKGYTVLAIRDIYYYNQIAIACKLC